MSIEGLLKAFELERKILGIGEKKCPVEAIVEAETLLGVTFPPTYRYFLEYITLNTLTPINGVILLDNGELDARYSGIIFNTLIYRTDSNFPLPQDSILVDHEAPEFMHILDTTQVDQNGDCKVICWLGDIYFDSDYPDLDGLYLQLVNGAIYSSMMEKSRSALLLKQEVNDYIGFYKSLGYTGDESRFLKKHWETLLQSAQ
ncbi:MAG: SMI1/KNR4 family protein [Candidatus Sericytochromatia bacterium]